VEVAYARVVSFEGVDSNRMREMSQQIQEDERPDDIPATEIVVMHDPDAGRALVVLFFETEDDYRKGDAALNAMDPGETPGRRASVDKYEVALRRTD
jgi:hypothetical protein